MDVAETAWQLRQRLSLDLIDYHQTIGNIALLQQEVDVHDRLIALYTKRLSLGLASNIELTKVQLLRQKKHDLLLTEQANTLSILRKIATDAGLPTTSLTPEHMQTWQAPTLLTQQNAALSHYTPATLQESALLNRVDIRRSLTQYAVAETKIKLEIAKQTPDISLTPGLLFEFGDKIWSLGFSSLLALANQHGTQIKQAEQLRAVEGAKFEALQAKVMGDVAQRWVEYHALHAKLNQLSSTKNLEQQAQGRLQKQFEAGLLDRLALTEANLNSLALAQQVHDTQFALLRALANLEHVMQKPLLNTSRYLAPQ
jgi:outer membrane protein TolC